MCSQENLKSIVEDIKITPLRLGIGAVGVLSFLTIFYTVWTAPGSLTPFSFLDQFVPSAREYRADMQQRRNVYEAEKKRVADEDAAKLRAAEEAKKKAADEVAKKP